MGTKRLLQFFCVCVLVNAALWGSWLVFGTFSAIGESAGWVLAFAAAEALCFLTAWVALRGVGWVRLGYVHDRYRAARGGREPNTGLMSR